MSETIPKSAALPIAVGGAVFGSIIVALLSIIFDGGGADHSAERELASLVGETCMVKGERAASDSKAYLRHKPEEILGHCLYACGQLGGLYDEKGEEQACELSVNRYFLESDMVLKEPEQ